MLASSNPNLQAPVACAFCFFKGTLGQALWIDNGAASCPICHEPIEQVEQDTDTPLVIQVPAAEAFACLMRK